MVTGGTRCYVPGMRRLALTATLPTAVLAVTLLAPVQARAGNLLRGPSDAPHFALLIDPLEALAVLYSGVIKVRPQFQWAFCRFVGMEASAVFTYASARFEDVQNDVMGGGGMLGMRFFLDYLSGPYVSIRAGPLGLKGGDVVRVVMLVEAELGWSWAPRHKGLIMNGGLGYQGYHPLDRQTRLHFVAAHTFMVNYSIGYAW